MKLKRYHSDAYGEAVKKDIEMAQNVGVQGVPFFVFDNKYAVSGAQHIETL
jgi:protein disulfide-isomerase